MRIKITRPFQIGCFSLVVLCAVVDMVYFAIVPKAKFLPAGSGIPSDEIVFYPLSSSDTNKYSNQLMEFIHPDGSGLETRSYQIAQSLFFDKSPVKYYAQTPSQVFTWSLDGTSIGGIYAAGDTVYYGYPVVVHADGSISYCDPDKSIIAEGYILVISENEIMAIQAGYLDDKTRLVIYDIGQCQITKVLYTPPEDEYLAGFSYTSSHWLALGISSDNIVNLRIYDPDMNFVSEIKDVTSAFFSKDGQKIAYIDGSGNVCVTGRKSLNPTCHGTAMTGPSWSPDSKWLVYSDKNGNLIKQNVNTGEETIIGKGLYPDWRP
jgi:WD40 repeat protein